MACVRNYSTWLFLLCSLFVFTNLHSQGIVASARLLSLDFNRESQWNPLEENLQFPSGGGLFIGVPQSRYLTFGGDLRIGQVVNAVDELIRDTEGENIFSLTASCRVQHTGNRFWLKPYLQAGIGGQLITNEDGLKPNINLGAGVDIKLFKNIYLNLGSSFTREISRNRFFLDYGVGLTFALFDHTSVDEEIQDVMANRNDFDSDGIADVDDDCPDLAGPLAASGCPDADGDGIADHLDNCPDEAGLANNDGCPMYATQIDRVHGDSMIVLPDSTQDLTEVESDSLTNVVSSQADETLLEEEEVLSNENADSTLTEFEPIEPIEHVDVFEPAPRSEETKRDTLEQVTETEESMAEEKLPIVEQTGDSTIVQFEPEEHVDVFEPMQEDEALNPKMSETKNVSTQVVDSMTIELTPMTDGQEKGEVAEVEKSDSGNLVDRDGDGIADRIDQCPDLPGTLDNSGCPESTSPATNPKQEIERKDNREEIGAKGESELTNQTNDANDALNVSFGFDPRIHFPKGLASIQTEYIQVLEKVASFMERNPQYGLRIYGHTDNQGSENINDTLSENRARACYLYLQYLGVSTERMSYHGRGEYQPVSDNLTEEGQWKNRRVVFELHR